MLKVSFFQITTTVLPAFVLVACQSSGSRYSGTGVANAGGAVTDGMVAGGANTGGTATHPSPNYFEVPFMGVSTTASPGSIRIAGSGETAPIHYSAGDAAVVGLAANALRDDIQRVTGLLPTVSTHPPAAAEAILIGTVGSSPLIDALVATGKISVVSIQGKWEAYTAAVVDHPMAGVSRALIIAGADRRGTAFGVFGLSESMGVSPWYFWGDVPTLKKPALYIAGTHTQPSPAVKFRGLFFNDEDWGLQPWAAKTFETAVGNIGPKTYATLFELLLRLHANVIWPAMHEWPVQTTPFFLVPGNKEAADNYAIVISTSHHEPMLRNSHEYDESVQGPYNYWDNRTSIYNFWDQRVKETAGSENIYTLGLRGRTDAGMLAPAGTTDKQKAQMIQDGIIPDQRKMIATHVNPDPSKVPQIFIPYKETLVQYQSGLQLPDDVTILWPDDNHGYLRQLSSAAERARSGGSGVYYHLSYWGAPANYLWLSTTPPGMTCLEMLKAWDFKADRMWLVNIGDLKPHEIGAEFFLRLARDPEKFRNFDQHAYLSQWAARNFGPGYADAIAHVLGAYFQLNIVKRPEHLNRTTSGFSFTSNGDEAQQRQDAFAAMTAAAEAIFAQLTENQKGAFYEMVLYPVRGSHLVNRRVLLAERSRLWAAQKRAATNSLTAESKAAHDALVTETQYYNEVNVGGKWNRMMTLTTDGAASAPFIMPETGSYAPPTSAGLGIVVEGSATPLEAGASGELPDFNRPADPTYFIDVYNRGTNAMSWTAVTSAPWIILSQASGNSDARLNVRIDWVQVPRGSAVPGTITLRGAGATYIVNLHASYPLDLNLAALPIAVENNGVVTIEAEDFNARLDGGNGTGWRRIDRATASKDGMTIQPVTTASLDPAKLPVDAPSLTYDFHAYSKGPVKILTQCLPTHRITSDHLGVRYAISLNGEPPRIVDVHADEYSPAWNINTLRAAAIGVSSHKIMNPGKQSVQIRMIDAGVVLDKLTIEIASGIYEAEDLRILDSNTPVVTYTDPPASAGAGVHIQSTALDHFATLVIPDITAGSYVLTMRVKNWSSRGIMRMAVAENPAGPYVNLGGENDLYSATDAYTDLASLSIRFLSDGPKYLRITVTGKNPLATNYWILLDTVSLKPTRMTQ